MASREYWVIGWSLSSGPACRGSTQHTSPLEPLNRQRESQVRIPITLLGGSEKEMVWRGEKAGISHIGVEIEGGRDR